MGLDMYLEVRKYVNKFDFSKFDRRNDEWPPAVSEDYASVLAAAPAGIDKYSDLGGINVSYPVGYWRKANAIHGWFVSNVQDGNDDCGSYHVYREQLSALAETCDLLMRAPVGAGYSELANDLLPPTAGFFFGNYEIDEYYRQDMKYTKEMIDHVLSVVPDNYDWSFYYSSSW
jgi:hypothetical protein